jgi:outer membrane protein
MVPGVASCETLLEAWRLAMQNDPRFRAAQAESRATGTAINQARAGLLPTVRIDVERTETTQRILSSQNPIFGAGVTTFPTDNETLAINQPIFRADVIERVKQARALIRQADYTVLAAEQDLILRTAAAYLVVLAAADSVVYARAEREAVGSALELARERLKMGLGTIVNQHDATARFAVTQARELDAQNRLRDARQGLREITGRQIETVQALRDEFPLETPDPPVLERWLDSAHERNLLLRARQAAVEVAKQEIERQRAGYMPQVNLLFNHNRRDSGSTLFGGGSNVQTTDMTLRLTVPVFEGGLTSAVTEEAVHRHSRAQEELELERRAVDRTARAAYEGTVVGVQLVQALRQSVVSQESALEAKVEGYKSGLFTLLPVLDAQRDLYLAKRDFAQSRYDYLLTRLRLKQAAGTLSEADLVSLGAALQ